MWNLFIFYDAIISRSSDSLIDITIIHKMAIPVNSRIASSAQLVDDICSAD